MRLVAYVRRGARAGISVLVMGATCALAQQAPDTAPPASTEQSPPAATPSESSTPPADATAPDAASVPTSDLPELVVDGQDKKKKKAVKAKQEPTAAPTTSGATAEAAEKTPTTTLGTAAPADIGTTTFDAGAVQMRTNGSGDANTFLRNLPNVQYQSQNAGTTGATSAKAVDTKPAEISISGGRTYENNFIINGVQANNILGNKERSNANPMSDTSASVQPTNLLGTSTQTVYVPSDFIGDATVIDSNASAEYGQFQGGVVIYNLTPAPFDRYHASVSASREDSDYSSYVNGRLDGTNPTNAVPPSYTKTKLSASLGAPLTSDFAVIGQVSRQEADSSKPLASWVGGRAAEYSDNVFMRFSAVAKTDIGKITLDTSRTDYFQHWQSYWSKLVYNDVDTTGTITKLEHETKLSGIRDDAVGLGNVRIKSRATLNTMDTENNSGSNVYWARTVQRVNVINPNNAAQFSDPVYQIQLDECAGAQNIGGGYTTPNTSPNATGYSLNCVAGGYGNQLMSQSDYGIDTAIDGDLLWGKFKFGGDVKHYDGSQSRPEDYYQATTNYTLVGNTLYAPGANAGSPKQYSSFKCTLPDGTKLVACDANQYAQTLLLYRAYDASAQVNAVHGFGELDQTLGWFNMRAGVRVDYDDYMENINVAPRTALTVKPFDGLSATIGYNQYYLGESLYYAVRSKVPQGRSISRGAPAADGTVSNPTPATSTLLTYNFDGLDTPYTDEYSAGASVKDPVLDGLWRFRYLERYGHDQFSTTLCPGFTSNCYIAGNDGSTSFRSASAEYTKTWNGLRNDMELNAVGVTGNVTWSEQSTRGNSYVINADVDGNNSEDATRIAYNGQSYLPSQFIGVVTGNLDIPVRFGATLSTVWLGGMVELNANAGVNLGYQGVADSGGQPPPGSVIPGCVPLSTCRLYQDRKYGATLKLDFSARINVTENAYIEAFANNVTNSGQNIIVTGTDSPWVLARTFWVGTGLKF